ncbi:MAG TPA: cysteine dioxygenase [Acidimicrobiaceae bacterium]|jgi:predicted metal-dependent enzyme (double-stranded beta helix superfamily)|nr:cysteine dioxygenase [Acidimicrobiaceae bacterium]|tara:strand:+ start:497 stop:1069 length:573 start_codon:yes stop_codon:yes gene_type:complete
MIHNPERNQAVAEAMSDIRAIDLAGITRESVEQIRIRLIELANQRDLFPWDDFPPEESGDGSTLYLISQDDDHRFALYVQSVAERTEAPPHDHLTWACIVGLEGEEVNRKYKRAAGHGPPEVSEEFVVKRGTGIGFLPDDVHSIKVTGGSLNFHCYGHDLLDLPARNYWDEKSRQWKTMKVRFPIFDARS